MISQEILPNKLVPHCLDILRTLSANERGLVCVVVKLVHDLRDPSDPEEDISVGYF
jgi:condensin complex subunit 3